MDRSVQRLFERMADSHGGDLRLLSWRGRRATLLLDGRARFTLEPVDVPPFRRGVPGLGPHAAPLSEDGLFVLRPLRFNLRRWYPSSRPVYVSGVPSAVLAVARRG